MPITITHIDTCFPDYLTDHHTRPGETLIGIAITETSLTGDVWAELSQEIEGQDDLANLSDDEIERALDDELPASTHNTPFDPNVQASDNDYPCAWFLIKYAD